MREDIQLVEDDDNARVGILQTDTKTRGKGQNATGSMADGMITTYSSENCVVEVVANRRQLAYKDSGGTNDASTLYAIDTENVGVSWKRKPSATKILEQGLGHTRTVFAYWTLWYGPEKAHGCIDCINEDSPFVPNP